MVGCVFVQYTKQINVHLLFVAYKYVCMHACTYMYVCTVHWHSPRTVSIHLFSPSVEMSILLAENIVDCMQRLSYVLHHSCLCVVRRPLVVVTTVGEDEETPPPQHHYQYPLFYQGAYSLCVCTQVHTYVPELWLCFECSFVKIVVRSHTVSTV